MTEDLPTLPARLDGRHVKLTLGKNWRESGMALDGVDISAHVTGPITVTAEAERATRIQFGVMNWCGDEPVVVEGYLWPEPPPSPYGTETTPGRIGGPPGRLDGPQAVAD